MKTYKALLLPLLVVPFVSSCSTNTNNLTQEQFLEAYNQRKDYSFLENEFSLHYYHRYTDVALSSDKSYLYNLTLTNTSSYYISEENYTFDSYGTTVDSDYFTMRENQYYYIVVDGVETLISYSEADAYYQERYDIIATNSLVPVENIINVEGASNYTFQHSYSYGDNEEIYAVSYEIIDDTTVYSYSYVYTNTFLIKQYHYQVKRQSSEDPSSYEMIANHTHFFEYYHSSYYY